MAASLTLNVEFSLQTSSYLCSLISSTHIEPKGSQDRIYNGIGLQSQASNEQGRPGIIMRT